MVPKDFTGKSHMSHLLTVHWLKQVLWPSLRSLEWRNTIFPLKEVEKSVNNTTTHHTHVVVIEMIIPVPCDH